MMTTTTPPESATPTDPPTLEERVAALEAALERADGAVSLLLFLRVNETVANALAPKPGQPDGGEQFRARMYHQIAALRQTVDVMGVVRAALAAQNLDTSVLDKVIAGYQGAIKTQERRLELNSTPTKDKLIVEK